MSSIQRTVKRKFEVSKKSCDDVFEVSHDLGPDELFQRDEQIKRADC